MLLAFFTPVLIALAAAGAVLLPLSGHKLRKPKLLKALLVLAPGVGFLAGSLAELPGWWQTFPPADSTLWLLWSWPIGVLLALGQNLWKPAWWLNALLRALAGLSYAWLVLAPMRQQGWSSGLCLAIASGFGIGLTLWCGGQEALRAKTQTPGWLYSALSLLLMLTACPLFLLGSSALMTQQATMFAALQFIPLLLLLKRPELRVSGLHTLNGISLGALWLNASLYSEAKPGAACSLMIALLPGLMLIPGLARQSPKVRYGLVLSLAGLMSACFVLFLWLTRTQDLYLG